MPTDFMVDFVAHIKRSEVTMEFPWTEVHHYYFVSVNNLQELLDAIRKYSMAFAFNFSTNTNPHGLKDDNKPDEESIIVALGMWSHISAKIKQLTGELSVEDETGKPQLMSGKDIVVQ